MCDSIKWFNIFVIEVLEGKKREIGLEKCMKKYRLKKFYICLKIIIYIFKKFGKE